MNSIELTQMSPGEEGRIVGFAEVDRVYRHKLMAMGLTRGASFKIVRIAPLGDPIELEVRGFSLSVRKSEIKGLRVVRSK